MIYDLAMRFFRGWRELTRAMEAALVDNLAATAPWLAPVIPAYMSFRNMTGVLEFPAWVAITGAVVVETLGLATVHTVFSLWDYNNARRKTDARAPVLVAVLAAGGYIVIVLTVNVLLDQRARVQMVAQALLSLLSVVAAVTLAVRANHARRLVEAREERDAQRMKRQAARNGQSDFPVNDRTLSGQAVLYAGGDWRELPEEDRRVIAGMSTSAEIMHAYNVPERTARRWKNYARVYTNHNGHGED